MQESENGTITADCAANQEVEVFVAAYDRSDGLIQVACETISQNATVSLSQQEEAAFYKAFIWNDSFQPLCMFKSRSATEK